MGDKMSPLSETTILVPSLVGGVTVDEHIKGMVWTVAPSFGWRSHLPRDRLTVDVAELGDRDRCGPRELARCVQHLTLNLLPLVAADRAHAAEGPALPRIFPVALFSGVLAWFTQSDGVEAFVDETPGVVLDGIEAVYAAMATGFVSTSGNATIDGLFRAGEWRQMPVIAAAVAVGMERVETDALIDDDAIFSCRRRF